MKVFSAIIKYSLRNRFLILACAVIIAFIGWKSATELPVDILPDIDKTMAVVVTEAPGMAPEEIESLVTLPLETALSGMSGVTKIRSANTPSLSLINLEFGWNSDPYKVRQLIQERLQSVASTLPNGINPIIAPISSAMGEIMVIGLVTENPKISPTQLRTIADYTVCRRLANIRGVAQALAAGGRLKQFRIVPDIEKMGALGITFAEIETAAKNAQSNTGGGITNRNGTEIALRNVGRTASIADIANTVVKSDGAGSVFLKNVADVKIGSAQLRGDAAIDGIEGVVITVSKQPDADTPTVTRNVENTLAEISKNLPPETQIKVLYRQNDFIQTAVGNVEDAIRDGAIMVVAVLFIFLFNIRATIITVAAIPMSLAIALIYFRLAGSSINTMTLGGLAVAIGMLVDDAIVDVENVHRRLRENAALQNPRPTSAVILDACVEIRASIFYATALILIVFIPTFGLGGIEGKMFKPLAEAVIVSMSASFLVALTLIPSLCSLLFSSAARARKEPIFSRWLKKIASVLLINPSIKFPRAALAITAFSAAAAFALFPIMGRDFIPPLNEGGSLLIVQLSPESAIERTREIGAQVYNAVSKIPEVKTVGMKIGRAEKDDHAEPVNIAKFNIEFSKSARRHSEVLEDLRNRVSKIAGISFSVGQPMAHRIDYMLSGTQAQIAVKIFGDDIATLLEKADKLASLARKLKSARDVNIEKQAATSQIKIAVNREKAALYGVQVGAVNDALRNILGGSSVAEVLENGALFDVFIRLDETKIANPQTLGSILVENVSGQKYPLSSFAKIEYAKGYNHINREGLKRRIVVSLNADDGASVELATQIRKIADEKLDLPAGYYVSVEGQFQSRIDAGKRIGELFALSLLAIFALLYAHFGRIGEVLQIMLGIPIAFAGGILATWYFIGTVSVASLIGMIALAGIAARNTIMMVSHYNHLTEFEGLEFSDSTILRGTLERLNPILMTALTAALALLPLLADPQSAGKEILYPVAVMIVGGLFSSTLLSLVATPAAFALFGEPKKSA